MSLTWLPWVLLALALLALFRKRKEPESAPVTQTAVNGDPATAGPPMVPGGTNDANADEALRHVAARQFDGQVQDFTILNRTSGRVYGEMIVSYHDGSRKTWEMSGQQAWRAQVQFPNGHQETIYMLRQCGNDLRMGEISRYNAGRRFRFVEDAPAAPPPAPAVAAPVPPPPAPVPTDTDNTVPQGMMKIEVRAPQDGRPAMVKIQGIRPDGINGVELTDSGLTVRFNPEAVIPKPATPTSAA